MKSTTFKSCQILIGAFTISFFVNGSARLSSILFPESSAYYDVDRNQASFPFVLCYVVQNIVGPLIGYLEQIFGIQLVIMTGCVLTTISITCCYFSKNILTITILWGVGFGAGYGLSCQLIPVILNDRFPQDKSKATSLFFAGSSAGAIVLPVLFEAFLHYYGMLGSYLLLGALMAHCIPAGIILNNHRKSKALQNVKKLETTENSIKSATPIFVIDLKKKEQSPGEMYEPIPDKLIYKDYFENNAYIHNEQVTNDSSMISNIISSNKTTFEINNETCLPKKVDYSLKGFDIFIDPVYIEILVIEALSSWAILVLWTIIIDFVRDKGVEEKHEIYFVICLPVAELISRLLSGYIIDKLSWKSSTTFSLSCVGLGILFLIFNFVSSYALLFALEITMSFLIATIIVEQVALVHEFIEEEKRTMAMACRMLMVAPSILTISPLIGYFRGNFGSYDYIIYITSGVSLLCAIITLTLPYLSRRRNVK